jgi:hypothetical protein
MTATGGSAADQARDKAQEAGAQAKEKVQEAGAQARSRVRDEVDRRSTEAGEQARSTADAVRRASQQLRDQGNEPVAKGMEQVADRMERAGGWLRESDGDSILADVEGFARRNPMAVAAGGLAVGFALSRLLKASSRTRYDSQAAGGSGNGSAELPRAGATSTPRPTGPGTATPPASLDTAGDGLAGGAAQANPAAYRGGLGGEGEGARHVIPPGGVPER